MGIQLKPQSKLMLYAQSAQIIRDFLISKDSFRNLVYAPGVEEKKQVFALVIQTLKYRNVLLYILSLAQIPGCLYHELVQYDTLLNQMNIELSNISNQNDNQDDEEEQQVTTATTKAKNDKSQGKQSKATVAPESPQLFTTRTDQHTVYYENILFHTKKSRLLWSQDQSRKEQSKNAENQLKNQHQSTTDDNNNNNDDSDNEEKNTNDNNDNQPSKSKGGNAEDEGDTTGISNSWFSAFITYNHQQNTNSKLKNKPAVNKNNTNNNNTNGEEIYRYPIECLLVLTYDLLFGSKELPKLGDLKLDKKANQANNNNMTIKQAKNAARQAAADARLKTFQQGIIDSIKLFNLPNPPKPLNQTQLSTRAKLIKKGKTYSDLEAMGDAIDNGVDNKKDKKFKPLQINFPILPTHYLSTPPILPPTGEFALGPGIPFKQRLALSLKYLTTALPIKPDSTPQQVQQQTHPDLFIPHELRGHYKRSIPRYIRVNTNKASHTSIIDTLIKEYNYTQLDVIPHMYQFPRPLATTSATLPSTSTFDQFDTKLPGFLDKDHVVANITPSLRRSTLLWAKYLPAITTYLTLRSPKHFNHLSKQPLNYKQSTAAERQSMQKSTGSSNNVFWVDPVLPDVLCFPPRDDNIVHCDLVKDGSLVIQDRSSCLPPAILNPPQGSICIDACSAPGNKTSYLSALLKNTGKIYAIELNQTRAKLMQNRMELTNSKNVEVVQTSFFDILPTDPKYAKVEYIMLDPSCSGSGNIHTPQFLDALLSTSTMISPFSQRQHLSHKATPAVTNDGNEEAASVDSEPIQQIQLIDPPKEQLHHVESLSRLQIRLLKHAMTFPNLKAFIYSTCSVYHLEDEGVVLDILPVAREHGFELISALPLFPGRGVNNPMVNPSVEEDDKKKNKKDKKDKKGEEEEEEKEENSTLKKQRNNTSSSESTTMDKVMLGTDLNKTVRVDHSLYQAGGFYVALFAKPNTYPTELLDSLLEETKERYPAHFQ